MLTEDDWKMHMRIAIAAASIARQCHDEIALGGSMPSESDMKCFTAMAMEISDLFELVVDRETEAMDSEGGK